MKWSDGEPADVRGRALHLPARPRRRRSERGYIGSGYLEPYLTNAGHQDRRLRRTPTTLIVTTEFPTTLLTAGLHPDPAQAHLGKYTMDQIADRRRRASSRTSRRSSGTGPYTVVEWEPGEFIRFERERELLGQAGRRRRDHLPALRRAPTRWSRRSRSGEIDYVRGVGADQFDALGSEPNITTVEGFANGYTYLSFNTNGNTGGLRRLDLGARGPRVPRRPRLCDRQADARRRGRSAGHGVPGTTNVAAVPRELARHAGHPRDVRYRARPKRRLDAAGYASTATATAARQGRQADHPAADLAGFRGRARDDRAVHPGLVRAARDRRRCLRRPRRAALDDAAVIGADADGDGQLGHLHVGLGRRPGPDVAAVASSRPTRSAASNDCFYSNAEYDELFELQQQATDVDGARRPTSTRCSRCSTTMRRTTPVLRQRAARDADRQVRGWTNQPPDTGTPLFGYGPSATRS